MTKPYNRTSAGSKLSLPESMCASTLRYGSNDKLYTDIWETPAKRKASSLGSENFPLTKATPILKCRQTEVPNEAENLFTRAE